MAWIVRLFMLEDATGSESNRNGVCLLGREDLLTKHGKTLLDGRKLTDEEYEYLENEAEVAFTECVEEFNHITKINRLNFETSGLCWFKKKFRLKNTRYLGWDSERTLEEMLFVEGNWSEVSIEPLYQARKYFLPEFMLSECNGTEMGGSKMEDAFVQRNGDSVGYCKISVNGDLETENRYYLRNCGEVRLEQF